MRGLYRITGRLDLLEQSLREEIVSLEDDPNLRLAGCLLELGMVLEQKELAGDALVVISRSEGLFSALAGEDAVQTWVAATHRARTLVKLRRPSEALPLFRRAIKMFENTPNDLISMLALLGAGQILIEGSAKDRQEGQGYLLRVQALHAKLSARPEWTASQ